MPGNFLHMHVHVVCELCTNIPSSQNTGKTYPSSISKINPHQNDTALKLYRQRSTSTKPAVPSGLGQCQKIHWQKRFHIFDSSLRRIHFTRSFSSFLLSRVFLQYLSEEQRKAPSLYPKYTSIWIFIFYLLK